ncbi:hypothetical protein VIGAN_11002300 [Vigna angularis var. angularis]|uniref:Uncharacterized protein n=1 Tax=Vigna angularis var. angularis TaxID=157739 RepID=A0A0S3T6L9_PHAAN|nr:hypothetical protein VIGAN_11002300 [Vigna angularis var. angularis]
MMDQKNCREEGVKRPPKSACVLSLCAHRLAAGLPLAASLSIFLQSIASFLLPAPYSCCVLGRFQPAGHTGVWCHICYHGFGTSS